MLDVINLKDVRDSAPATGPASSACGYVRDIIERLYSDHRDSIEADLRRYEATGEASTPVGDILTRAQVLRDADRILHKLPDTEAVPSRTMEVSPANLVGARVKTRVLGADSSGIVVPLHANGRVKGPSPR